MAKKKLLLASTTIRVYGYYDDKPFEFADDSVDAIGDELEMGCKAVAENVRQKFKHLNIEVEVE